MSDKMRWRYCDTNPVDAAVESSTVIEIGDLVCQDVDNAKPASAGNWKIESDHPNSPTLQELFVDNFLGVAMERSRFGNANPIRVATTGVFEFDCPGNTFELGDLIGVDWLTHPRLCLANQQVVKVDSSGYAIGRVAKRTATVATSVLIDIRSTVMTGGIIARGATPLL